MQQGDMRKLSDFFANGGAVQLALRDLRNEFSHTATLTALAGVAVVLGISGPFGTLDAFALIPRMAYWAAVVPITYAAGYLGTRAAHQVLPPRPRAVRIALAALGSALAVTPVLASFNTALGIPLGPPRSIALGFAAVYVICLVIETIGWVLQNHAEKSSAAPARIPALLARLPLSKRGALLALSSEDHYTRVITDKGEELLLIRLSDAIIETAPVQGVQIHRSHWVAIAAVASVLRVGDGGEAVLHSGKSLPIARARMKDLRPHGLLPRKGD